MLGFQFHKGRELSQFMSSYKVVVELFVRLKNMSDGRLNHVKQIHRQQKQSLKSIFVLIFSCCTNYLFSNSSFKKQHIKKDFHSFTERCQPRCCFLGWELTGDISRAFMFVRNLNFAVLFLFTVSRFSFMKRQELVGLCGENLSPRQY